MSRSSSLLQMAVDDISIRKRPIRNDFKKMIYAEARDPADGGSKYLPGYAHQPFKSRPPALPRSPSLVYTPERGLDPGAPPPISSHPPVFSLTQPFTTVTF